MVVPPRNKALFWLITVLLPLIFIPLVLLTVLLVAPNYVGVPDLSAGRVFLIQTFAILSVLPGIAIFLMWKLDLIDLYENRSKYLVIPLMVLMVFYVWYYLSIRRDHAVFDSYKSLVLCSLIGLGLAFFCSLFTRLSFSLILVSAGSLSLLRIFTHIKVNYIFDQHPLHWDMAQVSMVFGLWLLLFSFVLWSERALHVKGDRHDGLSLLIGVLAFLLSIITII